MQNIATNINDRHTQYFFDQEDATFSFDPKESIFSILTKTGECDGKYEYRTKGLNAEIKEIGADGEMGEWRKCHIGWMRMCILFHCTGGNKEFHKYARDEFARINRDAEKVIQRLKELGAKIEEKYRDIEVNVDGLSDLQKNQIKSFMSEIPDKFQLYENEWRFRNSLLRGIRRWLQPVDVFFLEIELSSTKIEVLKRRQLEADFLKFNFKNPLTFDDFEAIEAHSHFVLDIESALTSFKSNPDPRLGGKATKFSNTSRDDLDGCFSQYWKTPAWRSQFLDRLFITQYLGVEAEAYLLRIVPTGVLSAIFMSNKKMKGEQIKYLYGLVELAEANPCSLKYLRDRIGEASKANCWVNPNIVALVDRSLSEGRDFLE